ncbi:MAG: NAD(+) synthase, partial [Actinomycetota bacterium]|nr:NAD(+) synthase [Actinomycetota bacterium]
MDFWSAYRHGFARVAACTVPLAMADPQRNADTVIARVRELHDDGVAVAVFPELGLSGYAIDDLLLQDPLLDAVDEALTRICEATADLRPIYVVGAP